MDPIKQDSGWESELTLKTLILKIKAWISFLFSKKYTILIVGLLGGGLGLGYALLKKPAYVAELTFVVEDGKGSMLGAYAGIASQIGIDMPSETGMSGVFSGDNVIEFLQSRLIVEKALMTAVKAGDGKQTTLADIFIDANELREGWKGKPGLEGLHYPPGLQRENFSLKQDSIIKVLYDKITKDNLDVTKPDKKLGFIAVKCSSVDERFSKYFTDNLVKEATNFYIRTKTQRSKTNVDKLQATADSIEHLLNKQSYAIARKMDINQNPAKALATVTTELGVRDKMVLQTMFGEVLRNLEVSKMAMARETPVIQIVDTPSFPLKIEKLGKAKGIVIGGILAGFFICVWLIIRKLYKNIMES